MNFLAAVLVFACMWMAPLSTEDISVKAETVTKKNGYLRLWS